MPTKVRFVQYALPGLSDGNYALVASQSVGSKSAIIPSTTYPHESRFAVLGPRFALNPGELVCRFPPPDSLGEFSNVLPHVVLSLAALPWERSPDVGTGAEAAWLGVVLFDADDPAPARVEKSLLDLLPTTEKTESGEPGLLPEGYYFPPFPLREGTKFPELDLGESWSDRCFVVDVPVALFNKLMPTADDLGWLAQVREIELMNKSETYLRKLRMTSAEPPVAQVAEVVGNRFAQAGKLSTAHLVSLEQLGPVLPGPEGQSKLPDGTTTVRLVSLSGWTYTAASQNYTFAGLLMNVNRPGGVFTQDTLEVPFRETGRPADPVVANASKMGLAAFDHTTRLGDRTVSWFHGPFVPYNAQTSVPFPGDVADQFTRYNPDSGMFDMSYSAAWQLGRLMGLQSNSFSTALYNWKRGATRAVIQSVERQFLNMDYQKLVALLHQSLSNYTKAPANAAPRAAPAQTVATPKAVARPGRLAAVRAALNDPGTVADILTQDGPPDVPDAVTNFLARLRLLYGLPFNYLVPDERMLPPESLRFFYVDSAWVDCLLEGAFSIGNATSGDAAVGQALAAHANARANAAARGIRRSLLKMPVATDALVTPLANPTGFLLRSQVVTGWPGMEVRAYDASGTLLDHLRLEQVGPGVLLGIFHGVVQKLVLNEQPEALHFGVDEDIDDPTPEKFTKSFRYITAQGSNQPGMPVPVGVAKPISVPGYTRASESSVLQVDGIANAMQAELKQTQVYDGSFTAAEFALEMIEGVARVTFQFSVG